jgi:hypothetical protein
MAVIPLVVVPLVVPLVVLVVLVGMRGSWRNNDAPTSCKSCGWDGCTQEQDR